jgi:predicted SprT family Zn-dependent metalloprotease
MNLSHAEAYIKNEMENWGLRANGWTWKWDNAKRRHGVCKFGPKCLSFSRPLFRINDEAVCLDTIRHEVAHALAGYAAAHGPEWQRWAVKVGATPRARAIGTERVPPRWVGACSEGCHAVWERHRLTTRARLGACGACRQPITWRENLPARA